jgi:hypothetical protein
LLLALATAAGATYETPLPECGGCNVSRQPCVLHYGAEGVVRDKFTLEPIAGATIVVLDVQGVSGDDGSYHVEASRVTGCHQDYFYSVTATAPGYKVFSFEYYATSTFKNLTIELEPERAPNRYTVSGTVAEFPPCSGRMRGVTVRLEPLGLVTQTSNATVDGGTFAFSNVPIGDYTVRVAQGCSPLGGCWAVTPLRVDDSDVTVRICMDRVEPPPIPTPTACPVSTPCPLGHHPRPCTAEPCGLGCGCEACLPCAEGEILAPHSNRCDCVSGPIDPTPTPTPSPQPSDTEPAVSICAGDCNDDGAIGITELIAAVSEALGAAVSGDCASFDRDGSGAVTVDELIALVAAALDGCSL